MTKPKFDNDGTVFPGGINNLAPGMSWLDLCAIFAMNGLISSCSDKDEEWPATDKAARNAYEYAIAMLKEKRRLEGGEDE